MDVIIDGVRVLVALWVLVFSGVAMVAVLCLIREMVKDIRDEEERD